MRLFLLLPLLGLAGWIEGGTPAAPTDAQLIEELNRCLQIRFQDPEVKTLGMSRVARPPSLGRPFLPNLVTHQDFYPEREYERKAVASMEERRLQAGFYVAGRAVLDGEPSPLNYRALKGPAAVTRGTPRPAWYPGMKAPEVVIPDALPDWQAIYPLARKAVRAFADGGQSFESAIGSWQVVARPVLAGQARCMACHQGVELNRAIGGVIYAYRRAS